MEQNKNIWIGALAAVVLLFLFGSFGIGGYGIMGYGIGFWFVCMLLFWGFIIWIVVTLVNAGKNPSSDSLEILKNRYAKGEITKKQFERMKKEVR